MAKITPPGIEGSMVAITHTLMFISSIFLRNFLGIMINDLFVKVTTENLHNFWVLCMFDLGFRAIPLLYIGLMVPRNKVVDEFQSKNIKEA